MFIPDTLKFILAAGAIVAAVYGSAYGLARFPPEPAEIVKPLANEALRQG